MLDSRSRAKMFLCQDILRLKWTLTIACKKIKLHFFNMNHVIIIYILLLVGTYYTLSGNCKSGIPRTRLHRNHGCTHEHFEQLNRSASASNIRFSATNTCGPSIASFHFIFSSSCGARRLSGKPIQKLQFQSSTAQKLVGYFAIGNLLTMQKQNL